MANPGLVLEAAALNQGREKGEELRVRTVKTRDLEALGNCSN